MGHKIRQTATAVLVIILLLQSCTPNMSPQKAASRGGMRCGSGQLR